MRICLIGPKNSTESLILKTQAESMGYECKRVYMTDIFFELKDNKFEAFHRKSELLDFDVFVFRSVKKFFNEALLLAEYLYSKDKVVIDESLATERHLPFLSKLYAKYLLTKNGINQSDVVLSNGLKSARDVLMEIDHPILIKSIGEDNKVKINFSEDWTDSYDYARTNKNKSYVYLQSFNTDSYIKVFVIGNKVIGGIRRTSIEKEPKLNYSSKYKTSNTDITEEQINIAIEASKAVKFEISSVDMVEFEEKVLVLDVNRAPKFSSFQKATGVNYAEKVIDYCIEKHK